MENTLTIYLGDSGQDERRRRRRRRIAAGILVGVFAAALAPRTPRGGKPKEPPPVVGLNVPPLVIVSGGTTVVSVPPFVGPPSPVREGPRPPLPAKATFAPSRLDFGDGPLVRTSAPQLAIVRNTGGKPIEHVQVDAAKPFLIVNNCAHGIAPGAECVVAVGFAPQVAGTFAENLDITAGSQRARIALHGRATAPVTPPPPPPPETPRVLCFQPASLTFLTAGTKTVTLTNPESSPLQVTNIRILRKTAAGTVATGYDVDTTSCLGTLLPGQQCRFQVRARTPAMLAHETVQIAVDYVDQAGRTRAVHRATSCSK